MGQPGPHVLFCAFAEVPGPSAAGVRTQQWLSVFGSKEVDALSLKGLKDAHIQRLGGARMMRVPNTMGKPFLEKLSTYERALKRQLNGDSYDLVWCADLFSASIAAQNLSKGVPLIVEIGAVPSHPNTARGLLGADDADLIKRWGDAERKAIRRADTVFVSSRYAAKYLSERVDARLLQVVHRAVDRSVFAPPSMEISFDDERRVVLFGGREGGPMMRVAANLAQALCLKLPPTVRVAILGHPQPSDVDLKAMLAKRGVGDRVELLDADGPLAVTAALAVANVVVVPSAAEDEREPFGIPHRALEAMACGRAVVLTGPEVAFKDAAVGGEHFLSAPARDPGRVAELVLGLLGDGARRDALARAGARHMEASADLEGRARDLRALIQTTLKVELQLHAPRGEEADTSSRSAPPAEPPRSSTVPAAKSPVKTPDFFEGLVAPAVEAQATARFEAPTFADPEGLWQGDTFLDAPAAQDPDPAKVRAAMLVSSVPSSESIAPPPRPPAPTSVTIEAQLKSSSNDPWVNDTIADAPPLEESSAKIPEAPGPKTHMIRSLLVDKLARAQGDLTAEDTLAGSSSASSDE